MWTKAWRDAIWNGIDSEWDIVIVGGGISGAGILREAARLGLRALLVEQADFAWGTSSRSSKLVHGGLRYLKEGKIRLTRDSVREREQLLEDGPGLIEPLDFLLATYDGESPGRIIYSAGLTLYDLLALRWSHRYYSAQDFKLMAGQLSLQGLEGGFRYGDAQTDDARLVLRVLQESVAAGATAINYVKAEEILYDAGGKVNGLRVRDQVTGRPATVQANVVINATGAWAAHLGVMAGDENKIRPLRGSHLIFSASRVPAAQAITFLHPLDHRPVFVLPWEEVTLVGTTDVDHGDPSLSEDPAITGEEVSYLMAAVEARYPSLAISLDDIISSFAGIRPVISSGELDPSKESRDHEIWQDNGLVTVTGGKLTTFRLIARDVLDAVRDYLPDLASVDLDQPIFDAPAQPGGTWSALSRHEMFRLQGRYGRHAADLLSAAQPEELAAIAGTRILWAELRWAARSEGVVHLDDLLLRRVRLGLLVADGGRAYLPRIRAICQDELGWDDARWEYEVGRYMDLWQRSYSLPARDTIADWRARLAAQQSPATVTVRKQPMSRTAKGMWPVSMMVLLSSIALVLSWLIARRRGKLEVLRRG